MSIPPGPLSDHTYVDCVVNKCMDHSSSSGINGGKKQQDREEWGGPAGEVEDLMGGVGATTLWGRGDVPAWGTCTGVPGLAGAEKWHFPKRTQLVLLSAPQTLCR